MIDVVVLDVDDTLCLTEAACFELENQVLVAMGLPPMTRAAHLATWGMPMREAMPLRAPGVDVDAFVANYEPLLYERQADGRLDTISDENLATIDQLVTIGLDVMLLTSRTANEIAHMLADDHSLTGRVTAIYHGGNTTHLKPDPRAFDVVFAIHGVSPERCVYVGDSPGDAAAATGARMRFVASLESGVRTRDDFAAYEVMAFVDRLPEIVDVVSHPATYG